MAYLIQAMVGVTMRSIATARPSVAPIWLCGLAIESVIIGAWLLRHGSITRSRWPLAVDVCGTILVLAVAMAVTSPAERMQPWSVGVYVLSLSTAVHVGFYWRTLPKALMCSGALAVGYLASVVAGPIRPHWDLPQAGAIVNAFAILATAVGSWTLARVVRNLADLADRTCRRAVELERDRGRAIVHDALPYLNPERHLGADGVRAVFARQLEAKYRQMVDYVAGVEGPEDLEGGLRSVIEMHPELDIDAALDLTPTPCIERDVLERLVWAVDTALTNVEQNAPGAVVALDVTRRHDWVVVTVTDDGPGFEPAGTTTGFGIGHVLGRLLDEVGGRGTVTSRPGRGTEVSIFVPALES